jgi:hypothetical protein
MKKKTEMMHKEVLELISTLSDGTISDNSSSVRTHSVIHIGDQSSVRCIREEIRRTIGKTNRLLATHSYAVSSSRSFTMLPSRPKIFHGRKFEMETILTTLAKESPKIAILGGGGMGKTGLARAVLHHPDITTKFEHRFFVSAESATTSIELAALLGLHLKLKPGKDLTKSVVQYFSEQPPCLLILDNLETPWEPMHSRPGVEEFLSLLTDVPHLALIVSLD